MGYNTKNYTEQGGEVTHIGGKLVFDEGATVEGFPGGGGGGGSSYVLPVASENTLGGVKVGNGLNISNGVLSAESYNLPEATAEKLGGVKVGNGLSINNGVLSADPYTLPEATVESRGAVRSAESQDEINTTDLSVLVRAFNSLVSKLKNAGLMASGVAPAGA